MKFQGREYFLSEALSGETTGWVQADENIRQIWFGPVEVAHSDAAERTYGRLARQSAAPAGP